MFMLTIACVTFRMVRLFGGLGFKPGFGGHVFKPAARSCHRAALPLRSVAGCGMHRGELFTKSRGTLTLDRNYTLRQFTKATSLYIGTTASHKHSSFILEFRKWHDHCSFKFQGGVRRDHANCPIPTEHISGGIHALVIL